MNLIFHTPRPQQLLWCEAAFLGRWPGTKLSGNTYINLSVEPDFSESCSGLRVGFVSSI